MIIVCLLFFAIAIYIFCNRNHTVAGVWLGITCFLYGLWGLCQLNGTYEGLFSLASGCSLLIFCLYQGERIKKNQRLKIALFVVCSIIWGIFLIGIINANPKVWALAVIPYYIVSMAIEMQKLFQKICHVSWKKILWNKVLAILCVLIFAVTEYIAPFGGMIFSWISVVVGMLSCTVIIYFGIHRNEWGLFYYRRKAFSDLAEQEVLEGTEELLRPLIQNIDTAKAFLEEAKWEGNPPENMKNKIQLARESCRHASRILDKKCKQLSQEQSNFKSCKLLEIINLVVAQYEAMDRKILVENKINRDLRVWCDPVLIREAILNLMDNVTRWSEEEIYLLIAEANEKAVIKIIGSAAQRSKEIKEQVKSQKEFTKVEEVSYGFGYAYAKKVADLHEGHVIWKNNEKEVVSAELVFPLN